MNEAATNPNTTPPASELGQALRDFETVGLAWARYGINIGRAALVTSATTLRLTSEVLGRLSDSLRDADNDEKAPPTG